MFSYNTKATRVARVATPDKAMRETARPARKPLGERLVESAHPRPRETGLRLPSAPARRDRSFQVPASPVQSQAANNTVRRSE